MVSLEKAVVAYLERGGFRFEALVDPEAARKVKEGKALKVLEDQARPACPGPPVIYLFAWISHPFLNATTWMGFIFDPDRRGRFFIYLASGKV
jgi:hypothetical protein